MKMVMPLIIIINIVVGALGVIKKGTKKRASSNPRQ